MNRFVLYILLPLLFLFIIPSSSHAVDPTPTPRYAECDACGYCIGKAAPESWNACRNCLYPLITNDAIDKKTLEIIVDTGNPDFNQPVPPKKGRYYTQLGCVDTSLSSFSDPGAAGGVLNFILTKLIFPATGVLAFGALIYGSFMLITAQGAEMQIARGKRYVTGSIVGLIFTFSVVLIVNIIGGDVLRIPGLNSGTKITFVGYGTPTNVGTVFTYPNIVVQFDGKDIETIKNIQGSDTSIQSHTVYLPTKIDITNPAEIQKVTLLFNNDLCISCHPHPPENGGDRNIFNKSILFDGKPCASRVLLNAAHPFYGPFADEVTLQNNWDSKPIQCTSM